MKINKVNSNTNFGAILTPYDGHTGIIRAAIQQGISTKYISLWLRKINQYLPGDDYFVYLNDAHFDSSLNKSVRSVLVEKRNFANPEKSVWKVVRFDDKTCDYKKINWLPKYVEAVKRLSRLDFTR